MFSKKIFKDRLNRVLTTVVGIMGYHLVIAKKSRGRKPYGPVFPGTTYTPWLLDRVFNQAYDFIKGNTLVDKYRCYELWQLVEQTAKLEGALLEIGVWRGGTGALIARRSELLGIKERVYLCDTFKGVVKAGPNDSKYKGGEHADTSKEIVKELLHRLNLTHAEILTGVFPEETASLIRDEKIRFCHIDVDVYDSAKDCTEWVWPRLDIGGVVVFDDYGCQTCEGVTRFVDEQRNKRDRTVIHNLNGHGILIKTREDVP